MFDSKRYLNRNPLKSVTYRLPATYALMALLVVLILGAVLYVALRWYYSVQERAYLAENAEPIALVLGEILPVTDQETLQTQVSFFAFLARTRVEIFDADGQLLASGNLFDADPLFPRNRPASQGYFVSANPDASESGYDYLLISPFADPGEQYGTTPIQINGDNLTQSATIAINALPEGGTQFLGVIPAFDPERSPIARAWDRFRESSSAVYETAIVSTGGELLGTLRLSDGPAYGGQMIEGVVYGWLLASAVSVGLAMIMGWIASQDVVAPLQSLSSATKRMADGDLSARTVITRDDEFGQLGTSFNHMAQRIEETVSTLRHFLSDAAHEINTPITALRTNLELLVGESKTGTAGRALKEVKRLEHLTRQLLQLSRLETDTHTGDVLHVDTVALVREVAQFHASQAEQAQISLTLKLPDTPIYIEAYEAQMQQACANLVHNAIKFTEAGGQVDITLSADEGHGYLTVADSGIGIPEADLPHLFQRFRRGRNATRFDGSGLGLAIVSTIIERNGGTVTAENGEQGAVFTVTFLRSFPDNV